MLTNFCNHLGLYSHAAQHYERVLEMAESKLARVSDLTPLLMQRN